MREKWWSSQLARSAKAASRVFWSWYRRSRSGAALGTRSRRISILRRRCPNDKMLTAAPVRSSFVPGFPSPRQPEVRVPVDPSMTEASERSRHPGSSDSSWIERATALPVRGSGGPACQAPAPGCTVAPLSLPPISRSGSPDFEAPTPLADPAPAERHACRVLGGPPGSSPLARRHGYRRASRDAGRAHGWRAGGMWSNR